MRQGKRRHNHLPPSPSEAAMSLIERSRTRGSSLDGSKPRRLQNSAASPSTALTIQGPPTDSERRGLNAALEGVLHKAGANAQPCPCCVGRELAEQHARDRIRRLPRPDRARQNRRHHTGRRKAVITDHAPGLMSDEYGGEALLLIGEGARLQPVVKSRLATGELGHIVSGGKRFGIREEQGLTASPRSRTPTARDASGLRPSPERERPDAPAHP